MEWLVVCAAARAEDWLRLVEDQSDSWRCRVFCGASEGLRALADFPADAVLLDGSAAARAFHQALANRPPLAPPWVIAARGAALTADIRLPDGDLSRLPAALAALEDAGRLPRLAPLRHQQVLCLSRGMLTALSVPPSLRAGLFLPDMVALTVVHPPLLCRLSTRLYPLIGRRYQLTPAAVERQLRLLVESTWNRGRLDALDRFFGYTVDPERGKPTNLEFLRRLQAHLTLAGHRLW